MVIEANARSFVSVPPHGRCNLPPGNLEAFKDRSVMALRLGDATRYTYSPTTATALGRTRSHSFVTPVVTPTMTAAASVSVSH